MDRRRGFASEMRREGDLSGVGDRLGVVRRDLGDLGIFDNFIFTAGTAVERDCLRR